MKKPQQKTRARSQQLQAQDLAAVVGGTITGHDPYSIVGGAQPAGYTWAK